MDAQERDDVLETLRSAQRALRSAEKALVRLSTDDVAPRNRNADRPDTVAAAPAERALREFLFAAAAQAKQFEESDPQSFRARVITRLEELLRFLLSKQMIQETRKGSGTIQLDPTTATQTYERCLKACTENNLSQTDIMRAFVAQYEAKNWGDVDVETDLVFMRYETPGPITAHLNPSDLRKLVEAARKVPGAVDRCASSLRESGVLWEVSDEKSGTLADTMVVSGVQGQWAACVNTTAIVRHVVSLLSVVEVDYNSQQQGWWDDARIAHDLPNQLLPIIRNKDPMIVCHRTDIAGIEDWAASIPGWYEGSDDAPTPLIFRDAVIDDIL